MDVSNYSNMDLSFCSDDQKKDQVKINENSEKKIGGYKQKGKNIHQSIYNDKDSFVVAEKKKRKMIYKEKEAED